MRIDCDQDAVWLRVEQTGGAACHTGRRSCFYRAVVMEAEHTCMSVRGIAKKGALTLTSRFTGIFQDNPEEQARFLNMVRGV